MVNKVRSENERDALERAMKDVEVVGILPYSEALARADLEGRSVDVEDNAFADAVASVGESLERKIGEPAPSA